MANVKLTDVCKTIFAGGDVPKDNYSLEQDEIYSIPIYTNWNSVRSAVLDLW